MYHGTTPENRARIEREGFKVFHGAERAGKVQNGYLNEPYHDNIPPPIHHLGFGVYFTTSQSIGKQFNGGTARNLPTYYIATRNVGEINFGAKNTMMRWWVQNGYDPKLAMRDRVAATKQLTATLMKKYHAVWYKGKGLHRLLDGDQVCVYRPELIFQIDNTLSKAGEAGSKVVRLADGMKGVLLNRREVGEQYRKFHNNEREFLTVKWQRGGTDYNVYPSQVKFI